MERSSLGRLAGDKKHGEGPSRRSWRLSKKLGSVLRAAKPLSLGREAPADWLTAPQDRTVVVHVAVLDTERAKMNSVVRRKGSRETSTLRGSPLLLRKRLGGKNNGFFQTRSCWRISTAVIVFSFWMAQNGLWFVGGWDVSAVFKASQVTLSAPADERPQSCFFGGGSIQI